VTVKGDDDLCDRLKPKAGREAAHHARDRALIDAAPGSQTTLAQSPSRAERRHVGPEAIERCA
jgi:hypothetical protein